MTTAWQLGSQLWDIREEKFPMCMASTNRAS